ncbi:MAG: NAD-dependent epimerase/dehydratase family protein [Hyphomicrobiaceae bacterium]|nr:NAD-dependent epimerase/dehydratase family protein [Hyphomicrobiaceae bacterium]
MKILVTGATGYIGGSVATRLLEAGHHVVGLARSEPAAASLRQRGIEPVAGTLNDYGPLQRAARAADAVINAAQADNPFVVLAILPQLSGTGKVFIQTSGSSVVSTYDNGEYVDRVFHEDTPVTPMPEKATRVAIDEQVLRAALDGVRSVVIRPTLIYGRGIGVDSSSVQIPRLIEQALGGVARHVGRGLNVWSNVHISDVADLYLLALEHAPAGSLFYAENSEASMKTAAEAISRMLGLGGRTEDWPIEEAAAVLGPGAHLTFGSNSRVRALKARKVLGWDPKGPSLLHEIEHGTYKDQHRRRDA